MKIDKSFYLREDPCSIAKDMLGKILIHRSKNTSFKARIVETEAYKGTNDLASHAANGRRTDRTDVFYEEGGKVYTYLIYGMYVLFNITTNTKGNADAVLIRAVEPLNGIDDMRVNRNHPRRDIALTNGPGKLSMAMDFQLHHKGIDVCGNEIWLEDDGYQVEISSGPRVNVEYAGKDALLPWRYWISEHPYVSKT